MNQTFSYDALNRLTTAGPGSYSFDNSGNILQITGTAPTKPGNPSPVSLPPATGVSLTPTLAWSAAANATGLTLLLGTSNPPTAANALLQVNLPGGATSYTITSPLPAGATIFWRINSTNATGTSTGDVWSFTTATAPPADFWITSVKFTGANAANLELKFNSEFGATYRVEKSTTLATASWIDAGVNMTGNGAEQTITVPNAGLSGRWFFRVVKM